MKHKIMQIDSFRIEYLYLNEMKDRTIVFAHGLGGNLNQWDAQVSHFKSDFNVVTFSLQGHGKSSKSSDTSHYTIEMYADVVVRMLSELKINECIWIGNSMGGVIGLEIAKRMTINIGLMILNGTTPRLKYSTLGLKAIYIMDRVLIKCLGFRKYVSIAANATIKSEVERQKLLNLFLDASPNAIIMSHQLLGDYDYRDVLVNSTVRVVFVRTPDDKAINSTLDKERHWINELNHVCVDVKNIGGHVVNLEYPELYNQWIDSIIGGTL